jgi:hypothetical protein
VNCSVAVAVTDQMGTSCVRDEQRSPWASHASDGTLVGMQSSRDPRRRPERRKPEEAELPYQVELSTHRTRGPDPAWRLRVHARLRARALDLRLADGANPLASPALALRAQQLTDLATRRRLAARIEAIVSCSDAPDRCCRHEADLPFDMDAVRAAHSDLCALVGRLRDPQTVAERGVAMTSILLRDGSGPLYRPGRKRCVPGSGIASLPLRYCVRMALLCLDP